MDAVFEMENTALVLDKVEYVGWTDSDACIATGAPLVVDTVNENFWASIHSWLAAFSPRAKRRPSTH